MSRARPPAIDVADQRQGRGGDLAVEQLVDHALACRGPEVAVGQRAAAAPASTRRCGRSGTARPRAPRARRSPCPRSTAVAKPATRCRACGQAERRLLVQCPRPGGAPGWTASRGPTATPGRGTAPDANAASRRRLGRHLALEQVRITARRAGARHRGVGERGAQLRVGHDQLFDRFEVDRGRTERGRAGRLRRPRPRSPEGSGSRARPGARPRAPPRRRRAARPPPRR